jgi:hypothetical protein
VDISEVPRVDVGEIAGRGRSILLVLRPHLRGSVMTPSFMTPTFPPQRIGPSPGTSPKPAVPFTPPDGPA